MIAVLLVSCLGVNPAWAGIVMTRGSGLTVTGADGITYLGPTGLTVTGADGLLAFGVNGITAPVSSGLTVTGADGVTYMGASGLTATGADGLTVTGADGLTVTGADGLTVTGADGTTYSADSLLARQPTGLTATGVDGLTVTGADGLTVTGADSRTIVHADGLTATGADGLTVTGADGLTVTGADGRVFSISPNGVTITGITGLTITGADGVTLTGLQGLIVTGAGELLQTGLQSLDPELAILLDRATDDSNVNAAIVYHRLPTEADLADLQRIGILGGTRYRALPVITVTATRAQLVAVSRLPAVRALYGNRTLQTLADPGRGLTGVDRARQDADLTARNAGLPASGRGVTVAVIDTGLDSLHGDLAGRVVKNLKPLSLPGVGVGFAPPIELENIPNTDLVSGHGTFVAGVIAGSGARSGGKYTGVAPGAQLVGLSAGDLNLFFVLEAFDYLLTHGAELGVRVVNCSFSANTVYDANDPVNVATQLLTGSGINVVFSVGNSGPGLRSLNPYAMAPWVISVGATDERGRLADFSSRGDFAGMDARPTLVAPGVSVIGPRATSLGLSGLLGGSLATDLQRLSLAELPFYATASGTSFSAPQVSGVVALMLEANPLLTPAQVRDILQRTATPLPPYYRHEVGAGMLNAHAAVLEAAFPERRMGALRATLDRGQVRFTNDPLVPFSGTAQPGAGYQTSLTIPPDSLSASVQIAWGPLLTTNDLGLSLFDPGGARRAASNTLNLPGLTGRRERVSVTSPGPGSWQVRVAHTIGLLATPQAFAGTLEVTRVEYAPMQDLAGLSPALREEIYQNLRSLVMGPVGQRFRPEFSVSRQDLATALLLGGRVPQYLAGQPRHSDVRDRVTRLIVESTQNAPGGPLFADAAPGARFGPDDRASRLVAAVALVRAAGLRAEAEARAGALLLLTDAWSIPGPLRGYVAVALDRGLLAADGTAFRPGAALTRAQLAHAMARMTQLATQ